jgi:hypothetical protein
VVAATAESELNSRARTSREAGGMLLA